MQTAGHYVQAIATDGTVHKLTTDAQSVGDAVREMASRLAYRGLVLWAVTVCKPLEC